jgi:hypothetical protein
MSEPKDDIENLLRQAQQIAARIRGSEGTTGEFVLAIYHELRKNQPKPVALYPRIVKMYVKRNEPGSYNYNPKGDIYSRVLVLQLTGHITKDIRLDWRTYEALGGEER